MAIQQLSKLDDYKLSHIDQDCRGWHCVNASGIEIGKVEAMLVDDELERVTAVVLDSGMQIPVGDITLLDGLVVVAESHLAGAIVTPPRSMG